MAAKSFICDFEWNWKQLKINHILKERNHWYSSDNLFMWFGCSYKLDVFVVERDSIMHVSPCSSRPINKLASGESAWFILLGQLRKPRRRRGQPWLNLEMYTFSCHTWICRSKNMKFVLYNAFKWEYCCKLVGIKIILMFYIFVSIWLISGTTIGHSDPCKQVHVTRLAV